MKQYVGEFLTHFAENGLVETSSMLNSRLLMTHYSKFEVFPRIRSKILNMSKNESGRKPSLSVMYTMLCVHLVQIGKCCLSEA